MSNEQVIYYSPNKDYRIITCNGLWGMQMFMIEKKCKDDSFWCEWWQGETLKSCFLHLRRAQIITEDEMKAKIREFSEKKTDYP